MNGVHDMGGMDGFGKVEVEPNEPPFHEPWEGRVLAMNRAMGATGIWNIDMSRHSREVLAPPVYLAATYYQKWFLGLRNMLLERGLIDADDHAVAGDGVDHLVVAVDAVETGEAPEVVDLSDHGRTARADLADHGHQVKPEGPPERPLGCAVLDVHGLEKLR